MTPAASPTWSSLTMTCPSCTRPGKGDIMLSLRDDTRNESRSGAEADTASATARTPPTGAVRDPGRAGSAIGAVRTNGRIPAGLGRSG